MADRRPLGALHGVLVGAPPVAQEQQNYPAISLAMESSLAIG
jgi:hypothetical protein